jgi:hypothetical protein
MCSAEFVTEPSSKAAMPHFDATIKMVSHKIHSAARSQGRTEKLIATVVLSDKVAQDLLILSRAVRNLESIG